MSCGSPVVTTKRGSIPEVAGEAAWYVDPTSSSTIASGISEVFYNAKMQQVLMQKGLEQATKFSWEKTAKETAEVYLDAVPRPSEEMLSEKADKQRQHYERKNQ